AAFSAAVMTTRPCPRVTLSESTTLTGNEPSRPRAAWRADSMVADSFEDRLTQTTLSAPSDRMASKASWNWPGEGAAVDGRPSVSEHRAQNSLVDSSVRSISSSSPKRMRKGTRPTPSSVRVASGRSQAVSVTTLTPATLSRPPISLAIRGRYPGGYQYLTSRGAEW